MYLGVKCPVVSDGQVLFIIILQWKYSKGYFSTEYRIHWSKLIQTLTVNCEQEQKSVVIILYYGSKKWASAKLGLEASCILPCKKNSSRLADTLALILPTNMS